MDCNIESKRIQTDKKIDLQALEEELNRPKLNTGVIKDHIGNVDILVAERVSVHTLHSATCTIVVNQSDMSTDILLIVGGMGSGIGNRAIMDDPSDLLRRFEEAIQKCLV